MMRTLRATLVLLVAAAAAAAAAPLQAQSFETHMSRGDGRALALVRGAGDWQHRVGYTFEMYGAEVEWGRWGAHGSAGRVGQPAAGRWNAATVGIDRVMPLGRGIPVLFSVGAEYAQAGDPRASGTRSFALPLSLSNGATLDFGTFWFHPTLVAGASLFHRTTAAGSTLGPRADGATGFEVGRGAWSVRARLKHNMRAPQRGEAALRVTF